MGNEHDGEAELTLEQASELVRQRLDKVRLKYLELHSTPYLVKAGGMALLASVLFFGLIWSLQWGHRRVRKWLANRLLLQKGLIPHQWRQVAGNVEIRLLAPIPSESRSRNELARHSQDMIASALLLNAAEQEQAEAA